MPVARADAAIFISCAIPYIRISCTFIGATIVQKPSSLVGSSLMVLEASWCYL